MRDAGCTIAAEQSPLGARQRPRPWHRTPFSPRPLPAVPPTSALRSLPNPRSHSPRRRHPAGACSPPPAQQDPDRQPGNRSRRSLLGAAIAHPARSGQWAADPRCSPSPGSRRAWTWAAIPGDEQKATGTAGCGLLFPQLPPHAQPIRS